MPHKPSDLMPHKPSETCDLYPQAITLGAFCQPPPHKNPETHTFLSSRLINNAYGSRRDNT